MGNKRTVLITGGAKGIGKGLVNAFKDGGYNIAFCYNNSQKEAQSLLDGLINENVNALKVKCDVSKYEDVKKMYDTVKAHFGFVDTVINNAGIAHFKLFTQTSEADFDAVVNTNMKSVFNVSRLFLPDMIGSGFGRIINISSIWGIYGASMETLYSMSKAGVIGLTKALAKEVAPSNITINAIAPGFIDTGMNAHFTKKELADIIDGIPAGKAGTVEDVANAALYLADEKNSFITAQTLEISGGI